MDAKNKQTAHQDYCSKYVQWFWSKNITALSNAFLWCDTHMSEWGRGMCRRWENNNKSREVIAKMAARILLLPSFSGWILVLWYFQIIVGGGELMTSHTMTASSPSLNSWGDGAFWKVSFSVEKNNCLIWYMYLQITDIASDRKKTYKTHGQYSVSSWGSVYSSADSAGL